MSTRQPAAVDSPSSPLVVFETKTATSTVLMGCHFAISAALFVVGLVFIFQGESLVGYLLIGLDLYLDILYFIFYPRYLQVQSDGTLLVSNSLSCSIKIQVASAEASDRFWGPPGEFSSTIRASTTLSCGHKEAFPYVLVRMQNAICCGMKNIVLTPKDAPGFIQAVQGAVSNGLVQQDNEAS